MAQGKRSSKRRINNEFNTDQALQLRQAGASYRAIADKLGVSLGQAHSYVSEALAALAAENRDKTVELRQLELERLDRMMLAIWPLVVRGDLKSMNTALKIVAQRAKLLGLEAPQQHEVTGLNGGKIEMEVDVLHVDDLVETFRQMAAWEQGQDKS